MGVSRLRRDWVLVVLVVLAVVYAVFMLQPVRQMTPAELDDPPVLRRVEVTVERIEPLPWTIQTPEKTIVARFALGWIGHRALLIRTGPEIPRGPTLRGMMQGLHGDEEGWVRQSPDLKTVVYPAELDVSGPSTREIKLGVYLAILFVFAIGVWIWRFRKRRALERAPLAGLALSPLNVPPPRSEEVVDAAVRKHAPFYLFAGYFVLYAMVVMAIPGAIVATLLEPQFFESASTSWQIEMFIRGFVLAAPVTYWPFHWWMRRRKAAVARVVRDGVVTDGWILSAVVKNPRSMLPQTVFEVGASVAGAPRRYRGYIFEVPDWARPQTAVRVIATPRDHRAIVIAPTGEDVSASLCGFTVTPDAQSTST